MQPVSYQAVASRLQGDPVARWSKWHSVAVILDTGRQSLIPWEDGVYRFRIRPEHATCGGEIVYIGRGGCVGSKRTSAILSRVGAFIMSAMGFWAAHSGGNRFHSQHEAREHDFSARDLEVSWRVDADSKCAEAEALMEFGRLPRFNSQKGRTCRRDACARALKLWNDHGLW